MQLWPWEDASLDEMELAYRRMRAMFEFLDKLGVDYWCFHDRSVQYFGHMLYLHATIQACSAYCTSGTACLSFA